MTSKKEFLSGLRGHITTLKGLLDEVGRDVNSEKAKIRSLQEERVRALEGVASWLLPNLLPSSLNLLQEKFPGMVSMPDVNRFRKEESDSLVKRSGIPSEFTLVYYEDKKTNLTAEIQLAEIESKEVSQTISDLAPGMLELWQSGYNTSRYPYSFFEWRYYSDWKRADEIVEALHKQNWEEVAEDCASLVALKQKHDGVSQRAKGSIEELEKLYKKYNKLQEDIWKVDSVILERLQTKVKSAVDGLSEEDLVSKGFENLISFNKKIADCQSAINDRLQPERKALTEEIGKLERLYVSAEKSKQKTIPDKFVKANPQNKSRDASAPIGRYSPGAYGSSNVNVTNHYQNYDNGFLDYLLYDDLIHHLGDHHHHHTGSTYTHEIPVTQVRAQENVRVVNESNYGRLS
jgi:hypothetical protein